MIVLHHSQTQENLCLRILSIRTPDFLWVGNKQTAGVPFGKRFEPYLPIGGSIVRWTLGWWYCVCGPRNVVRSFSHKKFGMICDLRRENMVAAVSNDRPPTTELCCRRSSKGASTTYYTACLLRMRNTRQCCYFGRREYHAVLVVHIVESTYTDVVVFVACMEFTIPVVKLRIKIFNDMTRS